MQSSTKVREMFRQVTVSHKDLRFGQIVYISVFYNISFSWLLPQDGFQFIFLCRVYCVIQYRENEEFRSRERVELHFREFNFVNFPRGGEVGMPPDPPRSSCLRHSTFALAAPTVHVCQLNHCIRSSKFYRKPCLRV